MIQLSGLNSCKAMAEVMSMVMNDGMMFWLVEGKHVTWTKKSENFELEIMKVGDQLGDNYSSIISIREKRIITQIVPAADFGNRLSLTSIPVLNDDGEAVAAFSIAIPIFHPVVYAFESFAPILVEMFSEGSLFYLTDLNKVVYKRASQKFDSPGIFQGYELQENDVAAKVIRDKKPLSTEISAEQSGISDTPLFISVYPLFDMENKNEVVATLGIIFPKKNAAQLRNMSKNLEEGLAAIASAVEELAASATYIHSNEEGLNKSVKEINDISEGINEIAVFIKRIADKTKMLGMNAAIEAARASGISARGFGVVAEEIRKLSDQSKSTVPQITKLTDNIKQKVEDTANKSLSSLYASQDQAAATEEVTASIEEITAMSEELNRIAMEL